jgi:hypothetical protein
MLNWKAATAKYSDWLQGYRPDDRMSGASPFATAVRPALGFPSSRIDIVPLLLNVLTYQFKTLYWIVSKCCNLTDIFGNLFLFPTKGKGISINNCGLFSKTCKLRDARIYSRYCHLSCMVANRGLSLSEKELNYKNARKKYVQDTMWQMCVWRWMELAQDRVPNCGFDVSGVECLGQFVLCFWSCLPLQEVNVMYLLALSYRHFAQNTFCPVYIWQCRTFGTHCWSY